eukprot:TRINITY_DN21769_c0_g2_i1.p1 TRINITY_DN21769_c0_g2~~TRINITY_DN21769_c0_g2_i1.p1  ORF type:complete len:303 (+),score=33.62 TRINITY_DN21769_c0_g2_i1:47-955(+)
MNTDFQIMDNNTLGRLCLTAVAGGIGCGMLGFDGTRTAVTSKAGVLTVAAAVLLGSWKVLKGSVGFEVMIRKKDVLKVVGVSGLLGIGMGAGVGTAVEGVMQGTARMVCCGLWTVGICLFHQGEFSCVVFYRGREFSPNAFLLPGIGAAREYNIAIATGIVEFLLESYLFPQSKELFGTTVPLVSGILMSLFAVIRIVSMAQCGSNFSHIIEHSHRPSHTLVTTGLYRYLRHPSYFGWFWWSVTSQLTLLNPLCAVAYTLVSYQFFSSRIPYEEDVLASSEFFGTQYDDYRRKVSTGIPFIR